MLEQEDSVGANLRKDIVDVMQGLIRFMFPEAKVELMEDNSLQIHVDNVSETQFLALAKAEVENSRKVRTSFMGNSDGGITIKLTIKE